MTTAEKLRYTADAVDGIRRAIILKGVDVREDAPLGSYPDKIGLIRGAGERPEGHHAVSFYDYIGNLIHVVYVRDGGDVAQLPAGSDIPKDGLVFREWNWTKENLRDVRQDINVGATYMPSDGKTHAFITLTAITGLSPSLFVMRTGEGTLTIEWGDGTVTTRTDTGNLNMTHTYPAQGNYEIKLGMSSETGTYSPGNGMAGTTFIGGAVRNYQGTLTKLFVGSAVKSIGNYAFQSSLSLRAVSLHEGVKGIGTTSFQECYSLLFATIPSGVTIINSCAFEYCYALRTISIPKSVTGIGSYCFDNCISLNSFCAPGVNTFGGYALSYCSTLQSIVLPAGLRSIGDSAFVNNCALTAYRILAEAPPSFVSSNALTGL